MSDRVDKYNRVTNWGEMVGKTIRHVNQHPTGKIADDLGAVIIFDDFSWATLFTEIDGSGCDTSAYILLKEYSTISRPVTDYLSPGELLNAGMINFPQFELLIEQQEKEKEESKIRRAAYLQNQIDELMGNQK